MKNDFYRVALLSALLPLVVGGCATQDVQRGARAEPATPVASAPLAAAATPPANNLEPPPVSATPPPASDTAHAASTAPPPAGAAPQPAATAAPPNAAVAKRTSAAPQPVKPARPLPPPSEDEKRHGIQITQIGVTAAGGLVDFRFKVLDATKAKKLLANRANAPMLIAGDKPPLMAPHNALKGAKFGTGLVYYILYPNVRGAVKPGAEVTVAMGAVRLGPVTAR